MSILFKYKFKINFTKFKPSYLCCKQINTTNQRNALNWSRRSKTIVDSLKVHDNLPKSYELIYRAPLEKYLKWAKNTSTVTAALIAGLGLYKYSNDKYMLPGKREITFNGLVSHDEDIWYYAMGFIALNIVLRIFVLKYPLRIYRNVKEYVAIYDSQIPFVNTKHAFNKGEVREASGFLNPWSKNTYYLGKKTSLLLPDYFRTPSEFHEMF